MKKQGSLGAHVSYRFNNLYFLRICPKKALLFSHRARVISGEDVGKPRAISL